MATNGRRKIIGYQLITWLVVALFSCLTMAFGILFLLPIMYWLIKRERGLAALRVQYGIGLGHQMLEVMTKHQFDYEKYQHEMIRIDLDALAGCKTCGCLISVFTIEATNVCPAFQDVFPHNPNVEPDGNNPFEWGWFKYHGYEPPPLDWPKGKVWVPAYYGKNDFIQVAEELGKQYWLQHHNSLWDMGIGNIPPYYVKKSIDSSLYSKTG